MLWKSAPPLACRCGPGISAGTLPDGTTRLSADGETIYRMTAVGALAERVVMPASGVLKLTHNIARGRAALLGSAALTGIGAAREVTPAMW